MFHSDLVRLCLQIINQITGNFEHAAINMCAPISESSEEDNDTEKDIITPDFTTKLLFTYLLLPALL